MHPLHKPTLLRTLLIITCLIIAVVAAFTYVPGMIRLVRNPDTLADYLASFGYAGYLVFILFEIIQVVIAVIPGDLFHIAAGYIFKMPLGFILAYAGEAVGALISFTLARLFGKGLVSRFVREARIQKLSQLINSSQGVVGTLILCLVPAIPKDILVYVAGITPVKPARFLTVFLMCRIPDILIKSSGGAAFSRHDYIGLTVVISSFLVLLGIGYILKKKVITSKQG